MNKRNTIQKELVLHAVFSMKRHVTADEVYEFIQKDYPTIGKGTVYRNLSMLSEDHKITRVELPSGPDRFDYKLEKHYHVRCVSCGNVFDVEMDEVPDLEKRILDTHGITFLDYDILFKGVCPDCQKEEMKGE